MPEHQMKPIWFFVGLILSAMGIVILFSGIYQLIVPPATTTVLADTHPNIWWGALMTVFGGGMYFAAKKNSK
jgi:divalent metal cation (Fe/Co/Zn/Cd) transporter